MHSIVVLFLYIVYAVIHTVIKTIDQQSLVFVYYIKPSFCWYVVKQIYEGDSISTRLAEDTAEEASGKW